MFSKGNDFYFITYNLLLILKFYNCYKSPFKDYRKLTILIELLTKDKVIDLLNKNSLNDTEIDLLHNIYSRSIIKNNELFQLLVALNKQGYVTFKNEKITKPIDIYLNDVDILDDFLSDDIFEKDRDNIKKLNSILPRLKSNNFNTFVKRIFEQRKVEIWQISL